MVDRLPRRIRDSPERIKRFYLELYHGTESDKDRARKYVAVNEIILRCKYDGMDISDIYEIVGLRYFGLFEISELDNVKLKTIERVAEMLNVDIGGLLEA